MGVHVPLNCVAQFEISDCSALPAWCVGQTEGALSLDCISLSEPCTSTSIFTRLHAIHTSSPKSTSDLFGSKVQEVSYRERLRQLSASSVLPIHAQHTQTFIPLRQATRTRTYAAEATEFKLSAYATAMLLPLSSSKIWICTALGAYWLLVRVLRYRRRDSVSRRLNVSKVWRTLMELGL